MLESVIVEKCNKNTHKDVSNVQAEQKVLFYNYSSFYHFMFMYSNLFHVFVGPADLKFYNLGLEISNSKVNWMDSSCCDQYKVMHEWNPKFERSTTDVMLENLYTAEERMEYSALCKDLFLVNEDNIANVKKMAKLF